jgi:mannose/fructose/N-acetylgalactosamine-specific phosphotransferase system component IIC
MLEIIYLSFLGAIFSLDVTAFGQFMISRPIVCCPILGYFLGDIKSGLWIGMIIELIWTKEIQMGAAIPHDATTVAVLTTVLGLTYPVKLPGVSIIALAVASTSGVLFKYTEVWVRYTNTKVLHWVETGVKEGKEDRIDKGILIGLLLFFIKAFFFYFIFILAGKYIMNELYFRCSNTIMQGLTLAWWFLPITGFAVMLINFNYKFLKMNYKK